MTKQSAFCHALQEMLRWQFCLDFNTGSLFLQMQHWKTPRGLHSPVSHYGPYVPVGHWSVVAYIC